MLAVEGELDSAVGELDSVVVELDSVVEEIGSVVGELEYVVAKSLMVCVTDCEFTSVDAIGVRVP